MGKGRPTIDDLKHAFYAADIRRHVESLRHNVKHGSHGEHEDHHIYEDAIHQRALEIISEGDGRFNSLAAADIAREALRTKRIKINRWYG